jgi:superfamily II DNA or RNA helicase
VKNGKVTACEKFSDYWKLIQKNKKSIQGFKPENVQGNVFGEPFFNFWIIDGQARDLVFVRIAEKDEDEDGVDVFCEFSSSEKDQEKRQIVAVNHKMYNYGDQVTESKTAGLAWTESPGVPAIITSSQVSIRLKHAIEARGGFYYEYYDIVKTTNNVQYFERYAEYLKQNVIIWKQREEAAAISANKEANRALEKWQIDDLEILKNRDRGVYLGPPGIGKTTIQAKLNEHWMKTKPGITIIISRTKALVAQVLEEHTKLNKLMPDRIAAYSDASHDMDLKDAVFVGTLNKDLEGIIDEHYLNSKNVNIGCVANHGSIEILNYFLKRQYHVRIIVDELAEIIRDEHTDNNSKHIDDDKRTTINALYNLNDVGLIDKIFSFDAVWKHGVYREMNDAKLWSSTKPVCSHTHHEMTYEKNILVPIELIALEMTKEDFSEFDAETPERRMELAANVRAMQYEIELVKQGKSSCAKVMCFSSGSDAARNNVSEMKKHIPELEMNEYILADTRQERRGQIKMAFADPKTKFAAVSNYAIWAKGIDVRDTTGVVLGYGRMPCAEILTHIIGRGTRRVIGERGLPVTQLKIKPCGSFYVPYLKNDDGGENYKNITAIYDRIRQNGLTEVKVRCIKGSTTKSTADEPIKSAKRVRPDMSMFFEEVSDDDVQKVEINAAIGLIDEKYKDIEKLAEVRTKADVILNSIFDQS